MTKRLGTPAKAPLIPSSWWPTLALLGCAVLGYFVLPKLSVAKHPLVGNPAPAFSLPVVYGGDKGNRIRLEDYRGRVVILDFWATWCRPCQVQMPIMNAFALDHAAEKLAVIGVSTDDSPQLAAGYARGANVGYPIVHDEARVFGAYGGAGLPTLVVIAPDGTVVAVRAGLTGRTELEELLKQASTLHSGFVPERLSAGYGGVVVSE